MTLRSGLSLSLLVEFVCVVSLTACRPKNISETHKKTLSTHKPSSTAKHEPAFNLNAENTYEFLGQRTLSEESSFPIQKKIGADGSVTISQPSQDTPNN